MNNTLSDLEIIEQIKRGEDDNLNVLLDRHSGIYCNLINTLAPSGHLSAELHEDRDSMIYNAALTYDKTKGMQFKNWIYQKGKYHVFDTLTDYGAVLPTDVDILNQQIDNNLEVDKDKEEKEKGLELIESVLKQIKDKKVKRAVELRYFNPEHTILSYKSLGKALNVSHETARSYIKKFITLAQQKVGSQTVCDCI